MDPIKFAVTPPDQECSLTTNLADLLTHLLPVPDQRKRCGIRYPECRICPARPCCTLSWCTQTDVFANNNVWCRTGPCSTGENMENNPHAVPFGRWYSGRGRPLNSGVDMATLGVIELLTYFRA